MVFDNIMNLFSIFFFYIFNHFNVKKKNIFQFMCLTVYSVGLNLFLSLRFLFYFSVFAFCFFLFTFVRFNPRSRRHIYELYSKKYAPLPLRLVNGILNIILKIVSLYLLEKKKQYLTMLNSILYNTY